MLRAIRNLGLGKGVKLVYMEKRVLRYNIAD